MPLKLNVGLSKKIGQPGYSSLGASCNVEVELDPSLIHHDLEAFHRHVRNAFVACREAVLEELSRHQTPNGNGRSGEQAGGNGSTIGRRSTSTSRNGQSGKAMSTTSGKPPAAMTVAQGRAIDAIAQRLDVDAAEECRRVFRFELDKLTVRDASALIDHLKGLEPARRTGGAR